MLTNVSYNQFNTSFSLAIMEFGTEPDVTKLKFEIIEEDEDSIVVKKLKVSSIDSLGVEIPNVLTKQETSQLFLLLQTIQRQM